jgi:hypothetical protein
MQFAFMACLQFFTHLSGRWDQCQTAQRRVRHQTRPFSCSPSLCGELSHQPRTLHLMLRPRIIPLNFTRTVPLAPPILPLHPTHGPQVHALECHVFICLALLIPCASRSPTSLRSRLPTPPSEFSAFSSTSLSLPADHSAFAWM